MRTRRRYWLSNSHDEREAAASAMTLDCPFCSAPLTSAATAVLELSRRCACRAMVIRRSEPEPIPPPPGAMAAAYQEIRQRLKQTIVGHDEVVQRLALLGARHIHIGGRQRALLIGPSASGKTTLALALSAALECPALVWDVSTSSESGWAGVDAGGALAELHQQCDRDVEVMQRAVVVLDEIDKLSYADTAGNTRSHRFGQQKSLLAWLGGGTPVRFAESGDRGPAISLVTDDMLVIGAGVFGSLPGDAGPAELVAFGFSAEFVSRFPVILRLTRLAAEQLVPIYREAVTGSVATATDFGYEIAVGDALLMYVANAVASGGDDVTPRAGMGWLQAAVDTALLRLLDLSARPGTRYHLRPDDVSIPSTLSRHHR